MPTAGHNPLRDDLNHILAHTQGQWDELRGQRLFITGGTGFFGCWLLESFIWANDTLGLDAKAVVLTRRPDAFRRQIPHLASHPAVTLLPGDVRNFTFPDGPCSHVIHAATEASAKLNARQPLLMLDTITEGTRHTLDFAVRAGAKKFLLTSSGAVYGQQPPEMPHISEDYPGAPSPLAPASAYGEGKRLAEHLCALYQQQYGIETKIARCFAFVGPYLPLDAHFAVGNFIRDRLAGGPIRVNGDGTPFRSYLYAADLAAWLWTLLFRAAPCRPYNVGSHEPVTILETARAVAESATPALAVTVARTPTGTSPQRYVPDITRATAELGLLAWTGLPEAIQKTVAFAAKTTRKKPAGAPVSHIIRIATAGLAGMFAGCTLLLPQPEIQFDAAKDFTRDVAPAGAWHYGWMEENGREFQVYDRVRPNAAPGTEGILNLCRQGGGLPAVGTNTTSVTQYPNGTSIMLPGQLELHPGPRGEYSVVKWTAPQPGSIQIHGKFSGLSGQNGSPGATTDVIYFAVGPGNGNNAYDSTALDAHICLQP